MGAAQFASEISAVFEARAILGEGPVWSAPDNALWWVDPRAPAIHRLVPQTGESRCWPVPGWVGSIAPARSGLVCATQSGFAAFDPGSSHFTPIAEVIRSPDLRLNDGKCDPTGRFWAGSLDRSRAGPNGRLFCLDCSLSVVSYPFPYVVYNGTAWNMDGTVMYTSDSWRRRIYKHEFDGERGVVSPPEVFAVIEENAGVPDGAAIDEEDHLWSVHFDGWRIVRYRPDGMVDRVIPLPVQRPTSCAFGGERGETLYVTSARVRLTAAELREQPLAGAVFSLDVGVSGRAPPPFGGDLGEVLRGGDVR